MTAHIKLIIFFSLFILISCEDISEDKRFSEVSLSNEMGKNVLIEDFTGQLCMNCPYASEAIDKVQSLYGKNRIIAVSIHGGDLALSEATHPLGLATTQGIKYQKECGANHWPCGIINRMGISEYTLWSGIATKRLQERAPADILIDNILDEDSHKLRAKVTINSQENITGRLQLWLTEDSISAPQILTDGTIDGAYIHRHVFRSSVNTFYGDEISISSGNTQILNYEYTTSDKWKSSQLYIVAIIYNDNDGVLQVKEAKCI